MPHAPEIRSGLLLAGTDPDLPPGRVGEWEKYADFELMATGGKATLHAVVDKIVGRVVAMKRLKEEFAHDAREQRRFLREARVTAQLPHPNTVPVYEIGRAPDDALYFTMKKVAGDNLFEILKRIATGDERARQFFPPSRRLEICADACLALAYAHARGVVHRDVKPENIWVGDFGEVILLDWGVAKVWGHSDDPAADPGPDDAAEVERRELERSSEQLRTLTRTGQLLGTPLYMSPEQVLGNRYLDERSDQFSMGIVLYEALALLEPFKGMNVRSTFDNIIHERPDLPSEAAQKTPAGSSPACADALVMRALGKKPGDRFGSMLELETAVREASREAASAE